MKNKNSIITKLEEAIDLVDKIEAFFSRIEPGKKISPGTLFQIYQNLILLREKIVEVRVELVEEKN